MESAAADGRARPDTLIVVVYVVIALIAVVAILVVVLIFHLLGQRKLRRAEEDALRARTYAPRDPFSSADDDATCGDPRRLEPGDMIDIRGTTFTVRGTVALVQDGFRWTESLLDTGVGTKAWISAEDDPDLEVVLWHELRGVTAVPGPPTIDLEGRRYRFDEAGSARFSSLGTTGLAPSGVMRFHDYEAGADRLSFEDYGFGWECARGEVLRHSEYRIYRRDTGAGPR